MPIMTSFVLRSLLLFSALHFATGAAQARQEKSASFANWEIGLVVEDTTATINVTIFPGDLGVNGVQHDTNPEAGLIHDWMADSDCDQGGSGQTDLDCNILYKITLSVAGGPTFDFHYQQ